MKDTIRLNFDFPREEYPYVKMLCASKGMTFREFATELLQNSIEEYEDFLLEKKARQRLRKMDPKNLVPFDDALKEAGWDEK